MDYVDLMQKTGKQYNRALPSFDGGYRGVDFTSNPSLVEPYRFAYLENMYRDYFNEAGSTVETIPGYRKIFQKDGVSAFSGAINGIFEYRKDYKYLMIHAGKKLYAMKEDDRDVETVTVTEIGTLENHTSRAFLFNGKFYILDGTNYKCYDGTTFADVVPYIPTIFYNGERLEQRNMLTDSYRQKETGSDGTPVEWTDFLYARAYYPGETPPDDYSYVGTNKFVASAAALYLDYLYNTSAKYLKMTGSNLYAATKSVELNGIVIDSSDNAVACSGIGTAKVKMLHLRPITNSITFSGDMFTTETVDGVTKYYPSDIFIDADGTTNIPNANKLPPSVMVDIGSSYKLTYGSKIIGILEQGTSNPNIVVTADSDGKLEISVDNTIDPGQPVSSGYQYRVTPKVMMEDGTTVRLMHVLKVDSDGETNVTYTMNNDKSFKSFPFLEPTESVQSVTVNGDTEEEPFLCERDEDVVVFCSASDDIIINATAKEGEFSSTGDHKPVVGSSDDAIKQCTLWAFFDERVFLSGNPNYPSTVFYCQRDDTGEVNPGYFGILNYFNDGTGLDKVTGMLGAGGMLMVLKENNIYYHEAAAGDDIVTRIYPSFPGNAGIGGLGACCNFLDDPVFISRNGMDSVDKETLTLERVVGHRSGNVDKKLLQEPNLQNAEMVEWQGYLLIFVNGNVYMADSRQMFRDNVGRIQYEWYFLSGVGSHGYMNGGVFSRQKMFATVTGYIYGTALGNSVRLIDGDEIQVDGDWVPISFAEDITTVPAENCGNIAGCRRANVPITLGSLKYVVLDGKYYLAYETDEYDKGDVFKPAVHPCVIEDRLYFGDDIGNVYCMNTDKRGEDYGSDEVPPHEIHKHWYTFDGCAIDSMCATKSDNCGIPHLTKKTVRKSLVLKVRVMDGSKINFYVYTDREPVFKFVEKFTGTGANFGQTDYAILSYRPFTDAIMYGHEHEKRWVEKQIMLRDGGFMSPFGIYNMTYRFEIVGRVNS